MVGGGYAGLHAARALRRHGVGVTVVDRTGRHEFVTRLAAVAGGTAAPDDASAPLGAFEPDHVVGSVAEIGDGWVGLTDGRRLTAAAVVVAVGSVSSVPPIEGIEHAHHLRRAGEALALRHVLAQTRATIVVGGGPTGVQLAGAMSVAHPEMEVHLVEREPRLLGGFSPGLAAGARRLLEGRGVRLHLGHPVERITPDGVTAGGTTLRGVVVWAGGFVAPGRDLGLPTAADGRVLVDDHLRVVGHERTFAAGDIAAHHDRWGTPLPMSAQIAVRAGSSAGRNAARCIQGLPLEVPDLRSIGWVLDLGGRRGLASVGPVDLSAPVLDVIPPVLHDAIDVKELVELGGPAALRFVPESVRSLVPLPLRRLVPGVADPAEPVAGEVA